MNRFTIVLLAAVWATIVPTLSAAEAPAGLTRGKPELKSAGALAFGPPGVLFIGDAQAAAIVAVDTGDREAAGTGRPQVEGLDEKIAGLLGVEARELLINGLAVNPISGNTYLSVSRGRAADAAPAILRVDRAGKVSEFALNDVPFARAQLTKPVEGKSRQEAITHLGFAQGRLLVAGLSSEEFSSKLRSLPYPFGGEEKATSVEIFHGAHGKFETASPVRTFAPYEIDGKANILAAYTCTPLVRFPLDDLKPGAKVRGTTVAELGNRNRPLDMVVYQKGGKDFALIANNARGVIKVALDGIAAQEGITSRVADKAGLTYETIEGLKGVEHLDRFGKDHAVLLVRSPSGVTLTTIDLP
jgi:hypothetical protein